VCAAEAVHRACPSVAVVSHRASGLSRGLGLLGGRDGKLGGGAVPCPVWSVSVLASANERVLGCSTRTSTTPQRRQSRDPLSNKGREDTSKEVLYKLRGDSSNGSRRGGHFTVTTDTNSNRQAHHSSNCFDDCQDGLSFREGRCFLA